MTDIAVERAQREEDNANVSPEDLLKMLLEDMASGETEADGLIVVYVSRPKSGAWDVGTYRCGMSRTDELAFLDLARDQTLRNWRND